MVPADNVDTKEIVAQDADQFIKLLQEFKSRVKEVKDQLSPTLKRVNAYELNTTKGISYLSVKHYTLLQYITNLAFFLHLKLSGKQVGGHPVVESLVELRTLLEKMKPVEQKLKYQIDKLVRAATVGPMEGEVDKGGKANGKMAKPAMAELSNSAVVAADPLAFRPNPFNLANSAAAIGNDEELDAADASGLYRVKKIAPVTYDEDVRPTSKVAKSASRLAEKATRSRVMRELVAEMDDRPEEVDALGGVNEGMGFGDRADQVMKERDQYEEENFVRLMLSKKDRKKLTGNGRMRFEDEFENLNDFSNLVGIQTVEEQETERLKNVLNRRKQPRRDRDDDDNDGEAGGDNAPVAKRGKRPGAERSADRLFNGLIEDPAQARGRSKFDKAKRNIKKGSIKKGRKGKK